MEFIILIKHFFEIHHLVYHWFKMSISGSLTNIFLHKYILPIKAHFKTILITKSYNLLNIFPIFNNNKVAVCPDIH